MIYIYNFMRLVHCFKVMKFNLSYVICSISKRVFLIAMNRLIFFLSLPVQLRTIQTELDSSDIVKFKYS